MIRFTSLALTLLLMLSLFTACTSTGTSGSNADTTTTAADMMPTTTTTMNNITSDNNTSDNNTSSTSATPLAASVTAEQAQEIALSDAGLTADEVTGLKVEADRDNGKAYFDVQFYEGNTEYDYDIDAENGAIIEKNIDSET